MYIYKISSNVTVTWRKRTVTVKERMLAETFTYIFVGWSAGWVLVRETARGNRKNKSRPPTMKHSATAITTYNTLQNNKMQHVWQFHFTATIVSGSVYCRAVRNSYFRLFGCNMNGKVYYSTEYK